MKCFAFLICRASTPVVASSSSQTLCPPENNETDAQVDVSIHSGTIESHGLSQRCEETNMAPLEFSRFQNAVTGSGQTFPNAAEFRDALYLMSLAGRFRYSFKRNCPRHMSIICKVEKCPWKITCRAIGASSVVRVHTFRNVHSHSLEDVASSQPLVRTNRASLIIDKVIRSTPNYQPRQICKDFLRQHGVKLSYNQAWQLKEKAKERIHGHPKNYYKLLPWMCEKIVQTNPGTIFELTHSNEGHFEQLFMAHKVCIEGFANGCRPIIAVNSSQMNGPYGGVLFFATTYDADDCIFPLAFGVMRSEHYDDWFWFMQNLKKVVGDRDVVIISNRHPDLLRSVSEIFGAENHAYCYRHLKEDFVSFINNESTNGKKGRGNALYWLDSIAHARLDYDYDVAIIELRKVSEDLATWVESNQPEHWAMSKFAKKRWDKITTNLAESLNDWLRNDHHRSICDFLMEHMAKLGAMLIKHKEESTNWNGLIGPNIEEKLITNIAKGKTYTVTPFLHHNYGVCIGKAYLNVDIENRVCTCKAWQMLEIPCEHACAVLLSIGRDVFDFVDEWYKFPKQELIYTGSFDSIKPHDIPTVDENGVVRDLTGQILFSLLPPHTKRPPGRPRKRRIECHTTYCSRCHLPGHNRKTCKNTLCSSD